MAECFICGKLNNFKPKHWTNWKCQQCYDDELWESEGTLSPEEKRLIGKEHAIAQVPQLETNSYCVDIANELSVPEYRLEDAIKEGHLAILENRDIPEAIRYWAESEGLI